MKLLLLLLLLALPACPQSADEPALAAAAHDLCPREVVMLGETGTHGDGHTLAFKVALIERLVTQCGFDQVLFEASHYEFLHLSELLRTHQPASEAQLAAAVGGLWKFDREFQPLVPFLFARAEAGKLALGGLDDQLSGLGQDYANLALPAELAALVPAADSQQCQEALHRRIFSDYPEATQAAGTAADQARIAACLAAMTTVSPVQREMIASLGRWNARGYPPDAAYGRQRDHSMFQNFQWLVAQGPRHKTIVWAATVHLSKEGAPSAGGQPWANFGSLVHGQYGAKAFALGFAALGGSYREGRNNLRPQPPAPADALEAEALGHTDASAVYLAPARLKELGTRPAAVFQHAFQTLRWADYVDGLVVFREEHPPTSSR